MKPITLTYPIYIVAMFLLLGLSACSSREDIPQPQPLPEQTRMPIRWSVKSASLTDGRSLINNDEALRNACTPGAAGGKAIGIWSAYEKGGELTEHVLGVTADVSLTYIYGTSWDNWDGWTYGEKAEYWTSDAVFYFNAYFPKEGGMTDVNNTKTSMSGTYNTLTTQEDLMVERVRIDTGADDFKGSPVILKMKHALATMQFVFQMDEVDVTNKLKSFSLDNTLQTSGELVYDANGINWEDLSSSENASIYEWRTNGISFSATEKAIAYTGSTTTTTGSEYCGNDGHIFIIPQECETAPTFSFESELLSKEGISLGTTKFEPGYRYIYYIKVKGGEKVTLECVAQPWDLVETTNEFSTVVSVLEGDQINWTAGSHNDNDDNPNNHTQIVLWDDINKPAEFSFRISHPLGGTWHAILRTISGATDAFELRDTEGNIKTDGAVGEEVTLRVYAKRENTTTVSNVAELMFVVRSSGLILPVDIMTVLGQEKNYEIVQNINK